MTEEDTRVVAIQRLLLDLESLKQHIIAAIAEAPVGLDPTLRGMIELTGELIEHTQKMLRE